MSKSRRSQLSFGFDRFSGLYLWVLFILVFGVWTPSLFLTSTTVHSVAAEQSIAALVALAALPALSAGVFDLSVGATANLAAVIAAGGQTMYGWSMPVALAAALLAGILVGVVNGFVVLILKVESLIATLGMASILLAFQTIYAQSTQPTAPGQSSWYALAGHSVLGFPIMVVYLLVAAVILWWVTDHTPAGRYIQAIGGNEEAARLSGVAVLPYQWATLLISGGLSALAGLLYSSYVGPTLTFGPSLLLPAFAALFLGATQIHPGKFNVWGTLVAIYVLATGVKGLQLVTGVSWLADMFNGAALIAAMSFAGWRYRSRLSGHETGRRKKDASDDAFPGEQPTPQEQVAEGEGLVVP